MILLYVQSYISGENRPKIAEVKFHAQIKSVFLTETTNQPVNLAETLGNVISTTYKNKINLSSHSSDHSSQEANPTNLFCQQRVEISTKNRKKCISISANINLTTGFSSAGTKITDTRGKPIKLYHHSFPSSMKNGSVRKKLVDKWSKIFKTRDFTIHTANMQTQASRAGKSSICKTTANLTTTKIGKTRHALGNEPSHRSHKSKN